MRAPLGSDLLKIIGLVLVVVVGSEGYVCGTTRLLQPGCGLVHGSFNTFRQTTWPLRGGAPLETRDEMCGKLVPPLLPLSMGLHENAVCVSSPC